MPGAHSLHDGLPTPTAYLPAGHTLHSVTGFLPLPLPLASSSLLSLSLLAMLRLRSWYWPARQPLQATPATSGALWQSGPRRGLEAPFQNAAATRHRA